MSTDQAAANKALFARFHDAMNSGDAEVFAKAVDQLVAPDVLFHSPTPTGTTGAQALKQVWVVLLHAYPDLHVSVEDVIAEGDKVVFRNRVTGTHRGEFRGIAPTGRAVAYDEIFIFRFDGERIVEIWGVVDVLAQLRRLGVLPDGPA
ncbi:ester cyclase [Streptomyces sp. Q6]|uniref:Ester cyclase n=1 Tax=Streptomyces citrinus TaxID=3118173 RepID=A0ACD5AGB1_9ACTN